MGAISMREVPALNIWKQEWPHSVIAQTLPSAPVREFPPQLWRRYCPVLLSEVEAVVGHLTMLSPALEYHADGTGSLPANASSPLVVAKLVSHGRCLLFAIAPASTTTP